MCGLLDGFIDIFGVGHMVGDGLIDTFGAGRMEGDGLTVDGRFDGYSI